MEEGGLTYHRRKGVDASHGANFEWDLTTLTYLRLTKLHEQWKETGNSGVKSFFVANSMQNVGAFDDVVIRVEYVDECEVKTKTIFVQCKHAVDPRKSCTRFQKHMQLNSLKAYFDSFLRIRKILMEERVDEKLLDKIKNKSMKSELHKIQTEDIQQIKKLLNCNYNDFELLFYSNMETDYEQFSEMLEYNENELPISDYIVDVFNTAKDSKYDVRFKESAFHTLVDSMGYSEKDRFVLKAEFCTKFRMFFNQADELEFHVNKEIAEHIGSIQNVETIYHTLLKEVNLLFNNSDYCEPLSEKTELLKSVETYLNLGSNAVKTVDNFYGELRTSPYFSDETMNIMKQKMNTKILKISSEFRNLEKMKLIQFFINLSVRCLLLFLENSKDVSDWLCARRMQTYKTFSSVFICSEDLHMDFSSKDYIPYENEIFIQYEHQVEQNYYFDQLSLKCQYFILNSIVYIQGIAVKLMDICRKDWNHLLNGKLLFDMLRKKVINIGKQLPIVNNRSPSSFKTEILKNEYKNFLKQFANQFEFGHIFFMFTETDVLQDDKTFPISFKDVTSAKQFISDMNLDVNKTYHFCQFVNGEVHLQYSFGKQGDCTEKWVINEEDILDMNRKVTIFAEEDRMAKSTFLLSLARKYKTKNPTHFVYFININMQQNKYEVENSSSVIEFVTKSLLGLEGFEKELFNISCMESGNVALFFDAFDEISPDGCKKLDLLLLNLSKTKISRIFVTMRQKMVNFIERTHLSKSFKFQEHTFDDDGMQFLINDWNEKLKIRNIQINEKLLSPIAKILISSINSEEKKVKEILEIPLQPKLLSENCFESYIENSVKLDLYGLYNHFIKLHVRQCLLEQAEMKLKDLNVKLSKMSLYNTLSEQLMLPKMTCVPELLRKCTEDLGETIAICMEIGLESNLDPPVFLHRTMSEFLAAKFIVNVLNFKRKTEDIDFIFKSVLIDTKYSIVRKFINCLLTEINIPEFYEKANKYNISTLFDCKPKSTPLHIAATEGNLDIVKFLIQHDTKMLNIQTATSETALHLACAKGNIEIVRSLLSGYDDVENLHDGDGNTILHIAMREGVKNTIDLILNYCSSLQIIKNRRGESPLHVACMFSHTEVVQALISQYKNINNMVDNDGNTILHAAAIFGKTDMVKLILKQSPTIHCVRNYAGKTPLHLAIIENNTETTKTLIENNSATKISDDNTLLHYAIQKENLEIAKLLIKFDTSCLKNKNNLNQTPIQQAIISNNESLVKLLLSYNECSVHDVDDAGNTALHLASKVGNSRILILVLLRDRDHSLLEKQNNKGETPLYLACIENKNEAFMLLLTYKECPLELCNFNGDSVLHAALENENMEIINLILEINATLVNFQNIIGETPLQLAIRKNNVDTVKTLLCCSDFDETHLEYASRNHSSTEVMELLLQHKQSSINMKNTSYETHLNPVIRKRSVEEYKNVYRSSSESSQNAVDDEVKKMRLEQDHGHQRDLSYSRSHPKFHINRNYNPRLPHYYPGSLFVTQPPFSFSSMGNHGICEEGYEGYGCRDWNEFYRRERWTKFMASRESRGRLHYPTHSTEARDPNHKFAPR